MTKEQAIEILGLPLQYKYRKGVIKAACKKCIDELKAQTAKRINDVKNEAEMHKKALLQSGQPTVNFFKVSVKKYEAAKILELPLKNEYTNEEIEYARQKRIDDPATVQDYLKGLINAAADFLINELPGEKNIERIAPELKFSAKTKEEIENDMQEKIKQLNTLQNAQTKLINEAAQFLIQFFSYTFWDLIIILLKKLFQFIKEKLVNTIKKIRGILKGTNLRTVDIVVLIWLVLLTVAMIIFYKLYW